MKKAVKREHKPINWKAVFRMALAKKSNGQPRYTITEMAQKLGYFNKESDDPTQEFRGMLSRARTIGIRIDGKLTKLAKATVRRGGKPVARLTKAKAKVTKAPKVVVKAKVKAKAVKAASPKKAQTAPKVVVQKKAAKVAGKQTVAIQQHESGRVVSVKIGDKEALVPNKQIVPQLDNLAHNLGYKLVPVEEPKQEAAAVETAQAPTTTEETVAPQTPKQENPATDNTAAA